MSTFEPGEIVDITIKGVRIAQQRADGRVEIRDEFDDPYAMPPQAAVERVAPAEWPPRPGDLWRDTRGRIWFAVTAQRFTPPNDARDEYARDVNQAHGPLTLVHREDEQGGGAS